MHKLLFFFLQQPANVPDQNCSSGALRSAATPLTTKASKGISTQTDSQSISTQASKPDLDIKLVRAMLPTTSQQDSLSPASQQAKITLS